MSEPMSQERLSSYELETTPVRVLQILDALRAELGRAEDKWGETMAKLNTALLENERLAKVRDSWFSRSEAHRVAKEAAEAHITDLQAQVTALKQDIALPLGYHTLASLIADLRAQLAQVEQEREEWKAAQQVAKNEYLDMAANWDTVKQQLAAMTEERDALYNKLHVYKTVYGGEA